jgi:hypothetical protein
LADVNHAIPYLIAGTWSDRAVRTR